MNKLHRLLINLNFVLAVVCIGVIVAITYGFGSGKLVFKADGRTNYAEAKQIGDDYERYCGKLLELQGYTVEYHGLREGVKDLGRDLIARKGNETLIVQCKAWASHRRIRENVVFALYGTTEAYRIHNPSRNVKAVLMATTELSDVAREYAADLGIEVWPSRNARRR